MRFEQRLALHFILLFKKEGDLVFLLLLDLQENLIVVILSLQLTLKILCLPCQLSIFEKELLCFTILLLELQAKVIALLWEVLSYSIHLLYKRILLDIKFFDFVIQCHLFQFLSLDVGLEFLNLLLLLLDLVLALLSEYLHLLVELDVVPYLIFVLLELFLVSCLYGPCGGAANTHLAEGKEVLVLFAAVLQL